MFRVSFYMFRFLFRVSLRVLFRVSLRVSFRVSFRVLFCLGFLFRVVLFRVSFNLFRVVLFTAPEGRRCLGLFRVFV